MLTAGIEQKLRFPSAPKIGLSMMSVSKPERLARSSGCDHTRPMQRRIAHDAALADLPLPDLELRFHQDHHFAIFASRRDDAGNDSVTEIKLTSQTARSKRSGKSAGLRWRAFTPSRTIHARIVAQLPVQLAVSRRRWRRRAPRRAAAGNR